MSTNTHETLQNTTLGVATRAIHAGQTPDPTTGAVVTPIFMTSTFKQDGVGEMRNGYDYSRSVNPTRTGWRFYPQVCVVLGSECGTHLGRVGDVHHVEPDAPWHEHFHARLEDARAARAAPQ